eukprot:Platyproteum_vivax@DN129_c0_g1_i2.p1
MVVVDVKKYNEDGYLLLSQAVPQSQIDALRASMRHLLVDMEQDEVCSFGTGSNANPQSKAEYFLKSGDKIRRFYENGVFDSDGKLTVPKEEALSKLGHALHDMDPAFKQYSYSETVKEILSQLGYEKPSIVQSMYLMKPAKVGTACDWHQDSTFIHTSPLSCVGIWLALDDATQENGGMCFIPGSHKDGIAKRYYLNDKGVAVFDQEAEKPKAAEVGVDAKAGDLVLIHGSVWHYSSPNHSNEHRHAYSLHVVETQGVSYSTDNWLQRPSDNPFKLVGEVKV